jgi:N-acetylglucosamine malate deacetylase 2
MSTQHQVNSDLPTAFHALVEGRPPVGPVVLVVAHPGDEVIGVGGQLARWCEEIVCVHATDGARPAALERVGISVDQIHTLGFADQQLAFALPDLDREIDGVLGEIRPAVVMTHAFEGGHPDHDALALVLASVIERRRRQEPRAPLLVEFAGHWRDESNALATNRFAPPATGGERQLRLSTLLRREKNDLLGCFPTEQRVLHAFDTREEWIRPAPAYDFRALPNHGRVWYDQFDLPVRSDGWIRLAAAYLDGAPRERPIGVGC